MGNLCAGRVCAITGAGRGVGRAYADALVEAGAHVVVNDVDGEAVREAVDVLVAAGGDAIGHVGDVGTAECADALLDTALDRWGRIDAVVNNAGIVRDRMLVNLRGRLG